MITTIECNILYIPTIYYVLGKYFMLNIRKNLDKFIFIKDVLLNWEYERNNYSSHS